MKRKWIIPFALVAAVLAACILPCAALAEKSAALGGVMFTVISSAFVKGLPSIAPMAGNQFLTVDLIMKTAADAKQPDNQEGLLLVVDSRNRAYAPILFSGSSPLAAGLKPDEAGLRLVFEVPGAAESYDLVVLSSPGGAAAGRIPLEKSYGSSPADTEETLASVQEQGVAVAIHSVSQSLDAFADMAPEGMKYVWLDVTFTGDSAALSVSRLALQFAIIRDGVTYESVIPTRGMNMLSLVDAGLGGLLPKVRGRLCFLVPRGWTELPGIRLGDASYGQPLAIAGELNQNAFSLPAQDGSYVQGGWKVAVNSMKTAQKGALADPPAGYRYIIVNVTVTNTAVQKMTLSSELAFAMTDTQGKELEQAWFAGSGETLDAALSFNDSITGEAAFLLPDGEKPGTFRVHLSMLGGPLVIDPSKYLTE